MSDQLEDRGIKGPTIEKITEERSVIWLERREEEKTAGLS